MGTGTAQSLGQLGECAEQTAQGDHRHMTNVVKYQHVSIPKSHAEHKAANVSQVWKYLAEGAEHGWF